VYNISTGGLFWNNFIDITVSGGTITDINFRYPSQIYANGTRGSVNSGDQELGDGTVTVLWGSGGQGLVRGNVRYNTGFPFGMQWNSDEINVSNGIGTLGSINGASTISCGVNNATYSIDPVFGADSYVWTSSNSTLSTTSTSNSANFDVSNFRGVAQITVTAKNNRCNTVKTKTFNVSRVPARGATTGDTDVCSDATAYYSAVDMSNYSLLLGSNFTWSLPTGWNITQGAGSNEIYVQVPSYFSTKISYVSIAYTANDACGNMVNGSMSIRMLPNGQCAMQRIGNPSDKNIENKDVALSLYPNPSSEKVTLTCGEQETGTLKIYNKLGKEVANFDNVSNGFTFSVANFYTDTYTVRYITQDTVKTFQLVVHHN
jgi:hypothetical protein